MEEKDNSKKAFIIFDIETLVEEELFRKVAKKNQLERYDDEDEDYVPPAVYHLPICISYLVTTNADIELKDKKKFVFKSFFSEYPSKVTDKFFNMFSNVIRWCHRHCNKGSLSLPYPILVSHNGIKFDLPVLVMRAIKHYEELSEEAKQGLKEFLDETDKWEKERANYRNRYSFYNLDTYYFFYSSLKAVASLWGLESKTFMDGSEVKEFYKQGKLTEIELYCAEDVLTLGRILNKLLVAKGEIGIALPETVEDCETSV